MRYAALILALLFVVRQVSAEISAPPESLIRIDGCSGVCVDPSGVFVTAKHCECAGEMTVELMDGETVQVTKVYESHSPDGVTVYVAAPGGTYAYSPVAHEAPALNTSVHAWGFPYDSSDFRNLTYASGTVSESFSDNAVCGVSGPYPAMRITGMSVDFGWSGGPLFNESGEVVGLLSAFLVGERESYWITYADLAAGVRMAGVQVQPGRNYWPVAMAPLGVCLAFGTAFLVCLIRSGR